MAFSIVIELSEQYTFFNNILPKSTPLIISTHGKESKISFYKKKLKKKVEIIIPKSPMEVKEILEKKSA